MSVRRHLINQALESFTSLRETLGELTEEEVLACLDFEAGTHRRPSVLNRLIARAGRLQELRYTASLKEKYQWHANLPRS